MPDTEAPIANGSNESGIGVDMITTPNGVVARGTIEMWAGDRVKPFRAVALAPWPEVLDHAPPAALLAALARKVADTEQAENYDVARRIASLVSMTEAVPEVWKP